MKLLTDNRAASPVIGVILVMLLTIIVIGIISIGLAYVPYSILTESFNVPAVFALPFSIVISLLVVLTLISVVSKALVWLGVWSENENENENENKNKDK